MQDTALYQHLLGLKSPWTVSRVVSFRQACVSPTRSGCRISAGLRARMT